MGRLIDESNVIEIAEKCTFTDESEKRRFLDFVRYCVKEAKTVYDVDKVVEELEELANHYHKCCLADYNEGAEVGVRESMAIVRKGGINE